MVTSRLPGFYKLTLDERRRIAAEALGVAVSELETAIGNGGLDAGRADKTIENVVGTYSIPFALGLNVQMNGRDYLAPMVVEEPSVVAAASNAAKIVRAGGGFEAEADPPLMIAQIQLDGVPDAIAAEAAILEAREELFALSDAAVPNLVERGGGARDLEVRDLGEGWLVVHVVVDCRDAMGANMVNTVAEAVADRVAELAGGRVGLRILSNLSDRRNVRVRCAIPVDALGFDGYPGEEVRDRIVKASEFASRDPYRATTHNKGIMNGVDPVVIATGNDWRAIEAGAHAYAARNGRYEPLCTWRRGDDGASGRADGDPTRPRHRRRHPPRPRRRALRPPRGRRRQRAGAGDAGGLRRRRLQLRRPARPGHRRHPARPHGPSRAQRRHRRRRRGHHVEIVAREIHAECRVSVEHARAVLRAPPRWRRRRAAQPPRRELSTLVFGIRSA